MLKEIKYLIFIVVVALFIFLTGRYYFSDENKRKSYRSFKNNDEKINFILLKTIGRTTSPNKCKLTIKELTSNINHFTRY